MKRLAFLDSIRGFAILIMMVIHAFSFSMFDPSQGEQYLNPAMPIVRAPGDPLATVFGIFFFVTGISLAVSIHNRRKRQGFPAMLRHSAFRALFLIAAGIMITLPSNIPDLPFFLNGREPISLIGLADLFALPFVFLLSRRSLLLLSAVSFFGVTALLVSPFAPGLFLGATPLMLTGPYAVLKTFPIVLLGAAIGSHVMTKGLMPKKWFLISGTAMLAAYVLLSTFIYKGEYAPHTVYYFTIPLVAVVGLLGTPFFELAEERRMKLLPLAVFGRTGLFVYATQIAILALFVQYVPHPPGIASFIFLTGLTLAILWPISYMIAKKRWGNLRETYGELPSKG